MKNILFIILFISIYSSLQGQKQGEWLLRKKEILVENAQIQIDSFSIQDSFFIIQDNKKHIIPDNDYEVDFSSAVLRFKDTSKYLHQKITVFYLTYPSYLKKKIFSYTPSINKPKDSLELPLTPSNYKYKPNLLEGLKTEGSITRGFSSGNNQSLVMQSGMELKIKGNLSPKVQLEAVISDDNMPQAYAGISKSYKEFNYLYMKITAPKWNVLGGDFIEKKQPSYFLKYQRKLQGLQFETGDKKKLSVTGGIVDGQFNRQQFYGIDGNLGPYLLKGKNGEKYIFITKGSVKVYINGNLLQEEKNYLVDYELAQITFLPAISISSNDRITVEFNYSNQYYLRYLNQNQINIQQKKGNLQIYSYWEQDNKYHTLFLDLDTTSVEKLRQAGDNPSELYIESAKQNSYNENKILYKKITDGNNSYFEFTEENLPELYEVRFSYVGQNKGSYIIDKITAIGKIYKYVGAGNGDYDPVIKLTPPVSRKYTGVVWNHKINALNTIHSDIIVSNTDNNLFSSLDDNDNTGVAVHLDMNHFIRKDSIKKWMVYGKYRFVHQNFVALDPYVDPEFTYQWQIDSLYGKQHYLQIGNFYTSDSILLNTGLEYMRIRDSLEAYKIDLNGKKEFKKLKWNGQNSIVKQNINSSSLTKTNLDNKFTFDFKKFSWFHRFHWEKRNKEKNKQPDSLNFGFRFYETGWTGKTKKENEWKIGIRLEQNDSLSQQIYQQVRDKKMMFVDKKIKYNTGKLHFYLRWEQIHSKNNPDLSYYNFSLNWKQNWIKKWMESTLKIQTYNGNILRDEILFVETPPGQGVYQWNDYNQNGIKEINEFEIAVFSDQAKYIKVVLPSKNLLPVQNNLYSFQLILHPETKNKNHFLKRIYNRLHLETEYQSPLNESSSVLVWNPSDALLKNSRIQNDFFINRAKKKYKIHLQLQDVRNEQWLIIGKQGIKNKNLLIETTHHFLSQLIWQQSFEIGERKQFSENYPDKNFDVLERKWKENLALFKIKKNQFKIFYIYKTNESLSGIEHLSSQSFGLNFHSYSSGKKFLYAQIKYVYNKFTGDAYSPVAFYMLEGLQTGKNFLSELNYRKKLSPGLEAQFNYQFRISTGHKGIHTAGISMKMKF